MSILKISRRPGESFYSDGPCKIEVAEVNGKQVKFAITAPKSTNIAREELSYVTQEYIDHLLSDPEGD